MTFSSGFVHDGATLYCGEAPAMVAVSRILPHLFFTVSASSAILEEKGIQQPTYPTIIIESHARIPQKHPASPIRQNLSSPLVVSLRHFPSRQAPVYPLGGLESTAPSAGRDVSHLWESLYVSVLRRLGGRQSLTSNVVPSGSPSPMVPYGALYGAQAQNPRSNHSARPSTCRRPKSRAGPSAASWMRWMSETCRFFCRHKGGMNQILEVAEVARPETTVPGFFSIPHSEI